MILPQVKFALSLSLSLSLSVPLSLVDNGTDGGEERERRSDNVGGVRTG